MQIEPCVTSALIGAHCELTLDRQVFSRNYSVIQNYLVIFQTQLWL